METAMMAVESRRLDLPPPHLTSLHLSPPHLPPSPATWPGSRAPGPARRGRLSELRPTQSLGSSCELSKVAVHTGDTGFFFYIFMNRWGRNNFVPRPPYWHGRIEIREREMELEPWCDGLGELPSLS